MTRKRKRDTCICATPGQCGYREVAKNQVGALRTIGAVVKNGLGDEHGSKVLDGYWARSCWIAALDAKRRLGGGFLR